MTLKVKLTNSDHLKKDAKVVGNDKVIYGNKQKRFISKHFILNARGNQRPV